MKADAIAATLGGEGGVQHRRDGLWLDIPSSKVEEMARVMRDAEARFVTMTAKLMDDNAHIQLMYHWDLDGRLVTVKVVVKESARSIIGLWPGADWVERETRDYFDLAFEGRDETPPLMLRAGDQRGLFRRTAPVGRGADPAYTAKTGEETR